MGVTYCEVAAGHPWHGPYHDEEYGYPIRDDRELFERLILEINQAGLSWMTILKKREGFRRAYDGFDPEIVAREFLLSTGYLRGAHHAGCPIHERVIALAPPWTSGQAAAGSELHQSA